MLFNVERNGQGYYVIVPAGAKPLPALFDSKEQAERMARSLIVKRETPRRRCLDPDALPSR